MCLSLIFLVNTVRLTSPPSAERFSTSVATFTIAFSITGLGNTGSTGVTTPPLSVVDFLILTTFLNSS